MFSPYQSIITPTHKSPAQSPVTITGLGSILAKRDLLFPTVSTLVVFRGRLKSSSTLLFIMVYQTSCVDGN